MVFKDCGPGHDLRTVFTAAGDDLIELIKQLFRFDPAQRWDATQCLQARYFRQEPFICDDSELPLSSSGNSANRQRKRIIRSRSGGPPKSRRKLEFD